MKKEKLKEMEFLQKLQNFPCKVLFDAFEIENVNFILIKVFFCVNIETTKKNYFLLTCGKIIKAVTQSFA